MTRLRPSVWKTTILVLFSLHLTFPSIAQIQVNGTIESDTNNLQIVKVWGNHYERGFAYGYLLGSEINQVFNSYLKPQFGAYYSIARDMIAQGQDLHIDTIYQYEAKAIAAGMDSAGTNVTHMDYIDLLVCNSFLDIAKLMGQKMGMGCSSLLSWGNATNGTSLDGMASISRHLDWTKNPILINNQVLLVHLPSEENLQNWAGIGFAGMFSVLSGFNQHVGVFQHMMDDFNGTSPSGQAYEPIWFSLRKAIEHFDYNLDGHHDVLDVQSALAENQQGYAEGYLISALAANTSGQNERVALIAELAPTEPFLTFRNNSYADSIPGDNLYTANYQIARDSAYHFCNRYNQVVSALGNGTQLDDQAQWVLMRDHSHLAHNLQFMQFVPEKDLFRMANIEGFTSAYLLDSVDYSIQALLSPSLQLEESTLSSTEWLLYPNPTADIVHLSIHKAWKGELILSLRNSEGKLLHQQTLSGKPESISDLHPSSEMLSVNIDLSPYPSGLYYLELSTLNGSNMKALLKINP